MGALDRVGMGQGAAEGAVDGVGGIAGGRVGGGSQQGQAVAQILQFFSDHMSHLIGFLQPAGDAQQFRAEHDPAMFFEHIRPDDDIGGAAFILQGDEDHPLGGARPLTHQHQTGETHPFAVGTTAQVGGRHPAAGRQIGAQQAYRMGFQG